jgi:SAM-dependent methyltransferase/predicted metal-dependent enzyme (double-stranded beta helix superfamily)
VSSLDAALVARLADVARRGVEPDAELLADLTAAAPEIAALALPAPCDDPYSRLVLDVGSGVEVMVARWRPGARCAPHDHGGSQGLVTAMTGRFAEHRYAWSGGDLLAGEQIEHPPGEPFAFGADVIHDMAAGPAGGVTLHVYSPPPQRMSVYDLDQREVLDLVGDFGAWIPEGEHPRRPFAEVSPKPDPADLPEVIWVAHTTRYRGGSAEFAVAARTMVAELQAKHPDADVQLAPLETKADFVAEMERLTAEGRQIRELHFIGHSGMYGIMFGTIEWPEQFSPHEWRHLSIPFAPGARAAFHACRTARWFAPFFARTFGVPTSGNQGYTTVSTRPDKFGWGGPSPASNHEHLYLIATPGRKAHGLAGSVKKYLGASVEPMTEFLPDSPDRSYDKVAELYDRAYVDITVREAEWAWITGHAERAVADNGGPLRIVEIGCGNGALLRTLDDQGKVAQGIGLDDSIEMVGRARERTGADHPNLRFARIDGPVIELPDDSVDVALSFLSFRYLDWDPLMAEVRRVLAPGGRLWVVDMVERPVAVRELPLLAKSTVTHLQMPRRHPQFAVDLEALTSHPDWKAMVRHNPIRAEHEYRWYLESRFPGAKLEVLTVTRTQRVVAFDSGPLAKGASEPMSYP